MAEEIKIVASAVGFDQVNKALDSTAKTLTQTSEAASKAGKNLGNQLKVGTNQATQSLTDLSRVVQDAPYGFIGIANNINPLVESFSRLKAESGSTGGALKALLSGLTGPAGLGIAFAVVTSAISFAQMGLSRWGAAAEKTKKVVDEIKKAQEDFVKSLDSAKASALSSGIALQNYVDVAKNSTLPIEQRNEALKRANDILGEHGKLLTLTSIATAEGTKEIELYTKAVIAQAVAAKYTDQIATATIEEIKLKKELTAAQNVLTIAKQKADYADKVAAEAARAGAVVYTIGRDEAIKYATAVNKVNEIQLKLTNTQNIIKNSTEEVKVATIDATAAFGELGTKTKGTKKNVETLSQAIAKFEKELKAIQATGTSLGTPQFEINNDKIKEFESFLKKIIEKFNVDPKSKIYLGLEARLNELQYTNLIQKIQDKINAQPIKALLNFDSKKLPELPAKIKVKSLELPSLEDIQTSANLANLFSFLPTSFFKPFSEDTLLKIRETFTAGFESIAEDVAILFGQTLGDALTGQASIGDFFKGIFASLGSNLEALGKFLVKTAIEIELIQKTLFTNPFLAVAGGIALIAIGRAIQNATNRNAFAVGTRYAPGGMALVGERGPEMINLPRGSQVIPAAQTSQMMGGIGGAIEVFGMLRGQDIYFSNKKYGQTYKRTT